MNFEQVRDGVNAKSIVVLDVRSPDEIKKDGRISGSFNIPITEFDEAFALSTEEFKANYGLDKPTANDGHKYVAHCMIGKRALKATEKLQSMGVQVECYAGSFKDWIENNGDIERI